MYYLPRPIKNKIYNDNIFSSLLHNNTSFKSNCGIQSMLSTYPLIKRVWYALLQSAINHKHHNQPCVTD